MTIGLDYTFWIQLVNFLLLIFILNIVLYKPVMGILEKRKGQIEGAEQEIRDLNLTIEQKEARYEEKLRLAKNDALEQKKEIVRQGSDEAKGVLDAARAEIPKMVEQFEAKVSKEVNEARRILREQSENIATEIAEKVMGRSIK
ncbi:MAG: ATP synthase subunit b [Syntrophus sp. PtaU1.Bin005]|jgi:F-type H+-transporting ATPase subunit b|uniref:ATP synthase F0 subunit B n=1 Tax=Syntrophus TaxID=43773 RepID=UPI0009D0C381|nr:MAG: ATP synthase subunit b [Syntrophus sp. PtaB.Bin138]OPY77967.1 MAG: ATP synthase subunit b [Syntrophus sp. PtaU1.Bin005]